MTAFAITANQAFNNLDDLIATINDWLDRNDLTAPARQMIALAEDEMRIELEPYFLEKSVSLMTDTAGYVVLPSDAKRASRVIYDNRVLHNWGVHSPDRENTGSIPRGYTMERGGIRIWPNGEKTISVLYQPILPRLTDANPNNLLLDTFPSLYFYGSMAYAHAYLEDYNSAANYRGLFEQQLERVAQYYRKQARSGPLKPYTPCVP